MRVDCWLCVMCLIVAGDFYVCYIVVCHEKGAFGVFYSEREKETKQKKN
jgi:hypothetical protein